MFQYSTVHAFDLMSPPPKLILSYREELVNSRLIFFQVLQSPYETPKMVLKASEPPAASHIRKQNPAFTVGVYRATTPCSR